MNQKSLDLNGPLFIGETSLGFNLRNPLEGTSGGNVCFKLLTLIVAASAISIYQIAEGTDGKAGLNIISTKQKGSVDVFRLDSDQSATSSLLRLDLQLPTLKNHFTVAMSLDAAKRDYSNFILRNDRGEEVPLSDSFDGEEYSGSVTLSYQKGNNSFSGLLAGSLNNTPFSFISKMVSYNRTFLNKKRILGGRIISVKKEQPRSTFIDPKAFQTKERPLELNSFRYELSWNEAFNQSWRMNTMIFYGTRREDRPDHYGLELRNGVGIDESLTFRIHTGLLRESRTELKDDRGYFDIQWFEGSIYWEFKYDYSMEVAYGITIEKEDFSDSRGDATIGTDSLGLKFNYNGVDWSLSPAYIFKKDQYRL